jgi:ribosome maturation factor RimP
MSAREPTSREAAVLADVAAAVAPLHLVVDEVSVIPAGKRRLVRILLDSDLSELAPDDHTSVVPPVSLDAIAEATRAVSASLDASDVMGEQAYVLEVSSPGTDRALAEPRQYRRNVGRLVRLDRADQEPLTGRLVAADEDGIAIADEMGEERRVRYPEVTKAVVQLEFNRADEEN